MTVLNSPCDVEDDHRKGKKRIRVDRSLSGLTAITYFE